MKQAEIHGMVYTPVEDIFTVKGKVMEYSMESKDGQSKFKAKKWA